LNPIQVLGTALFIVGVCLVVASLLYRRRVRGPVIGGIILIGPIPIVFGKNVDRGLLLLLAISGMVMAITLLAVTLLLR